MAERAPSIQNRKAHFDYFIFESLEAGIALAGCEVKSIRLGKANLQDSFARVEKNENLRLWHAYFPLRPGEPVQSRADPYPQTAPEPQRDQPIGEPGPEKGLTLIPLKLYFKQGKVKLQLALAKGKNSADKRDKLKEKEANRDIDRALSNRNRRRL